VGICVCMFESVCVCVCANVCACVRVCACVCVCTNIYIYLNMCMYICDLKIESGQICWALLRIRRVLLQRYMTFAEIQ